MCSQIEAIFISETVYDCKDILPSFYLVKLPIWCYPVCTVTQLPVITFKKISYGKTYDNTNSWGYLIINHSYLYSRTQINFTVAIDFTASNGEYYDCPLIKIISK